MKLMITRNKWFYEGREVDTYSGSLVRVFREKGYDVVDAVKDPNIDYTGIDFLLDIDCGRDSKGQLIWQCAEKRASVPSGVLLIDTHGRPTEHRRLAKNYDHVFFAVWDKRDLFVNHPSAHFLANFTDLKWFNGEDYTDIEQTTDFLMIGSKHGLHRASPMIEVAEKYRWSTDVREVGRQWKHRWPRSAEVMATAKNLFNHGQKHDINLRIFESIAMKRPLICDCDRRSGIRQLFQPWKHFIPYEYDYSGLEDAMIWVVNNPQKAKSIAENAYREVRKNHLAENRVQQILEVIS